MNPRRLSGPLSPWLNAIEPHWVHGRRRVVEPHRLLSAHELADRVCAAFDCPHDPHLALVTTPAIPDTLAIADNAA